MFKLCSLPDICEQSVQMPDQGIEVLVFVLEKHLSEDKALYKVYMIPKRNHKVCQHFFIH